MRQRSLKHQSHTLVSIIIIILIYLHVHFDPPFAIITVRTIHFSSLQIQPASRRSLRERLLLWGFKNSVLELSKNVQRGRIVGGWNYFLITFTAYGWRKKENTQVPRNVNAINLLNKLTPVFCVCPLSDDKVTSQHCESGVWLMDPQQFWQCCGVILSSTRGQTQKKWRQFVFLTVTKARKSQICL